MTMQGMSEKMKRISHHQDDDDDDDDDDKGSGVAISLPKLGVDHTVRRVMRVFVRVRMSEHQGHAGHVFRYRCHRARLHRTSRRGVRVHALARGFGMSSHRGIVQQCSVGIGETWISRERARVSTGATMPAHQGGRGEDGLLSRRVRLQTDKIREVRFRRQAVHALARACQSRWRGVDAALPSKLSRPQSSRRAAHRFHEHDHTHMSTGAQRVMSNASAEASGALSGMRWRS